ncbi:hypothetical protein T06_8435 [Trichinella sp. T6]|nr:hypothetical protein T06_8435 [Trichinella sp. T6]
MQPQRAPQLASAAVSPRQTGAADVPSEHRAALVQYYTDAECVRAYAERSLERLLPKAFPPPERAANSVLLLQSKSGRCLDAVKLLIYQAIWSAWKSGGNCQTRRAGGELDHQAHRKNIFGSHSDAETSVGEDKGTKAKRSLRLQENGSTARRQARSGHKNCCSCGRVGHFSQDCEMCNGRGRASGELQLRLKSDMLVDTKIAVTLAVMEFNQSSVVLWNVPISKIWLEAASGTELIVTSACVMKIKLDLTFTWYECSILFYAKLKEGIFVGPDIQKWIKDHMFVNTMIKLRNKHGLHSLMLFRDFWETRRTRNNFGHISEEQDERFHQDIKQMEQIIMAMECCNDFRLLPVSQERNKTESKEKKKPYKIVQILGPKTYQLRGNPEAQAPYTSGTFRSDEEVPRTEERRTTHWESLVLLVRVRHSAFATIVEWWCLQDREYRSQEVISRMTPPAHFWDYTL